MKLSRFIPRSLAALVTFSGVLILALAFLTSAANAQIGNTATGDGALVSITTGDYNTADGLHALYSDTTGSFNTGVGVNALFLNTSGGYNNANGFQALFNNTGSYNTAIGAQALFRNTTGTYNTATGLNALYSNTTGYQNTADGAQVLFRNTTGFSNTATGLNALYSNTNGNYNTANGAQSLFSNTTGIDNTATGLSALQSNTDGEYNTANGAQALSRNTGGDKNTATGANALSDNTTGLNNTAVGYDALSHNTTGSYNVAVGIAAGTYLTTGSSNIDIFNIGVAGESHTIRIGTVGNQQATYIAGISGKTATGGAAVFVTSNGKLGTVTSSRRFKKDIADMDTASNALLALRPVTFRYKPELDKAGMPQYGLVAEEVAEVNPDLIVRDEKGEIYTVRYEAVNAMLLNEFLKEHRKVEQQGRKMQEQEASITQLRSTMAQQQKESQWITARQQKEIQALTASLKEQASQIQKVSTQIEMSRPAPQTVVDNLR